MGVVHIFVGTQGGVAPLVTAWEVLDCTRLVGGIAGGCLAQGGEGGC